MQRVINKITTTVDKRLNFLEFYHAYSGTQLLTTSYFGYYTFLFHIGGGIIVDPAPVVDPVPFIVPVPGERPNRGD